MGAEALLAATSLAGLVALYSHLKYILQYMMTLRPPCTAWSAA